MSGVAFATTLSSLSIGRAPVIDAQATLVLQTIGREVLSPAETIQGQLNPERLPELVGNALQNLQNARRDLVSVVAREPNEALSAILTRTDRILQTSQQAIQGNDALRHRFEGLFPQNNRPAAAPPANLNMP